MDDPLSGSDSEPPGIYPQTVRLPVLEPPVAAPAEEPALPSPSAAGDSRGRPRGDPSTASRATRFVISPRSEQFRRRLYPKVVRGEWNDWRWQLRLRIRDVDGLRRCVRLSWTRRRRSCVSAGTCPSASRPTTPRCCDPDDPYDPLRQTMIPITGEFIATARRGGRSAGRGQPHARARAGAPLSGPGAVPGDELLRHVLPLLHAGPHGRADRRVPLQHRPVPAGPRLHRRRIRRFATCCSPAAIR